MLSGCFLFIGLSSLALPGMSTFVSEFLVLVGTFTRYKVAAILATTGIILAALYILLVYQRTMQGPLSQGVLGALRRRGSERAQPVAEPDDAGNLRIRDLTGREAWVLAPLMGLILVLGIYPKPIIDTIRPTVDSHVATDTPARSRAHLPRRPRRQCCPARRRPVISHLVSASSAVVAAGDIKLPSISYSALSPILVVFGVACLGVLLEGFLPPRLRPQLQPVVAVLGFAAALGCVVSLAGTHELTAADAVAIDGPALFIEGTLVLFGMVSVLMFAERKADPDGGALVADAASLPGQGTHRLAARNSQTEAYPLMVFAVAGMMLFAAADNLLVMFVALEILSLPLYLLSGLARRRRLLSQEAALKYFLLGAFSLAFFLYGVAMLYGYSGTVSLQGIAVSSGLLGKTDFSCTWVSACSGSACCSRSERSRSTRGRRTCTRAPRRR